MVNSGNTTEALILEAAKRVFLKKGLEGARMQEIADEAGINKALLHYYFRNKEKLFDFIFDDVFEKIVQVMVESIADGKNIEGFVWVFVRNYLQFLSENPYLPSFLLNELNRNPYRVMHFFRKSGVGVRKLKEMLHRQIKNGEIVPVDLSDLMVDLIGMSILSVAGKPLIQGVFFDNDEKQYEHFLHNRANHISEIMIKALKKANETSTTASRHTKK